MAIIGCLGDVAFTVSSEVVKTLNNFTWSGSAQYATHERHCGNALTEFCGLDPDKISFDVGLSVFLGVNPMDDLNKLWKYEREGTALPLTIGNKAYGKYRWNLINHTATFEQYDGKGNMLSCSVSISLQEYLKE